jgi:hypothetical protein
VIFEGADELIGELVDVKIERATGFSLYGNPLRKVERRAALAA